MIAAILDAAPLEWRSMAADELEGVAQESSKVLAVFAYLCLTMVDWGLVSEGLDDET